METTLIFMITLIHFTKKYSKSFFLTGISYTCKFPPLVIFVNVPCTHSFVKELTNRQRTLPFR